MRMAGVVVHYSRRGFGLISAAETEQVSRNQLFFVQVRDIVGRRDLRVGQRVTFEVVEPTPQHPSRAVLVEPMENDSVRR